VVLILLGQESSSRHGAEEHHGQVCMSE
jgi:hypothetical protein